MADFNPSGVWEARLVAGSVITFDIGAGAAGWVVLWIGKHTEFRNRSGDRLGAWPPVCIQG